MAIFQHETLANPIQQIRLLEIHPARKGDPISISITVHERNKLPPYSALSYTWGSEQLNRTLLANGAILSVTENCWYALGQLRLVETSQYWWIDAICINQDDVDEKSAQVDGMGQLYRNASCCYVSLGRATKHTSFLCGVAERAPFNGRYDNRYEVQEWTDRVFEMYPQELMSAILSMGSHPYWSRLWIVQEFSLPERVYMLCGRHSLSLDVLNLLVNRHDPIEDLGAMPNLPMRKTMSIRKIIQESDRGLASFPRILKDLGRRECADPRDVVFGLLSLVEPIGESLWMQANYAWSATELIYQTLLRCANTSSKDGRPSLADTAYQLVKGMGIGEHDPVLPGWMKYYTWDPPEQCAAAKLYDKLFWSASTRVFTVCHDLQCRIWKLDYGQLWAHSTTRHSTTVEHNYTRPMTALLPRMHTTLVIPAGISRDEISFAVGTGGLFTSPLRSSDEYLPVLLVNGSAAGLLTVLGHGRLSSDDRPSTYRMQMQISAADLIFWSWRLLYDSPNDMLDFRVNSQWWQPATIALRF